MFEVIANRFLCLKYCMSLNTKQLPLNFYGSELLFLTNMYTKCKMLEQQNESIFVVCNADSCNETNDSRKKTSTRTTHVKCHTTEES